MFDDLALRRAKAMLVRQRAGLPLQEATEALHMLHNNTCTAHLRGPACRHVSSRTHACSQNKPGNVWKLVRHAELVCSSV